MQTPVKKVAVVTKEAQSPKLVRRKFKKVELTKEGSSHEIVNNKVQRSFDKKFENEAENVASDIDAADWSAFPDLDWAGFQGQPGQSSCIYDALPIIRIST